MVICDDFTVRWSCLEVIFGWFTVILLGAGMGGAIFWSFRYMGKIIENRSKITSKSLQTTPSPLKIQFPPIWRDLVWFWGGLEWFWCDFCPFFVFFGCSRIFHQKPSKATKNQEKSWKIIKNRSKIIQNATKSILNTISDYLGWFAMILECVGVV